MLTLRSVRVAGMLKIVAIVALLGAVAYGFAAANVVPESGAGDGSGDVSGYTISNITYTLLTTDPSKIQVVTLDVSATAGAGDATDVQITLDGGTTWKDCTGPSGSTWTCTYGAGAEPAVSGVSSLQVVAAQ